ncbi:MAG: hypothetical protein Kow0049_28920 [Stanieria sp.]
MTSSLYKLIDKLKIVEIYLGKQLKSYSNYEPLIAVVAKSIEQCHQKKITIKLAGYSIEILEAIKNFHSEKYSLVSYLNFEIVDLNQDVEQIYKHCELLCLIYDSKLSSFSLTTELIEQANLRQIELALIMIKSSFSEENSANQTHLAFLQTWQNNNYKQVIKQFSIRLDSNNYLECDQVLNQYYQFIEQLFNKEIDHYIENILQQLKLDLTQYFEQQKKRYWQKIYYQKNNFLKGENPEIFKQKLNQTIQKLNKEQQQLFKSLKQSINQYKLDLLNPFLDNSLMYQVQQAIEASETLECQENNKTYLYLIIKEKEYSQRISTYILNLCQEILSHWFEQEWKQMNYDSLPKLLKNTEEELKFLNLLDSPAINCKLLGKPSFELNNFISISIVEETSKTLLDYHYTQSTWFRLTIAIFVGLTIFVVTGKLFGFVIVVFQIINLFTAQNAKTIRIKQHTKELKRIVDSKYQSLVRHLCDRAGQILITSLDETSQKYQIELDAIVQKTDQQLNEVKQKINSYKDIINQLKQDQAEIEKLL